MGASPPSPGRDLQERVQKLDDDVQKLENGLTPGGVDLLERLSHGETISEIAVVWGLSQWAVYKTLSLTKAKLGARTACEAVALWVRNGGKA